MVEGVVDGFEVVEVDEDDYVVGFFFECLFECFEDVGLIGKIG